MDKALPGCTFRTQPASVMIRCLGRNRAVSVVCHYAPLCRGVRVSSNFGPGLLLMLPSGLSAEKNEATGAASDRPSRPSRGLRPKPLDRKFRDLLRIVRAIQADLDDFVGDDLANRVVAINQMQPRDRMPAAISRRRFAQRSGYSASDRSASWPPEGKYGSNPELLLHQPMTPWPRSLRTWRPLKPNNDNNKDNNRKTARSHPVRTGFLDVAQPCVRLAGAD